MDQNVGGGLPPIAGLDSGGQQQSSQQVGQNPAPQTAGGLPGGFGLPAGTAGGGAGPISPLNMAGLIEAARPSGGLQFLHGLAQLPAAFMQGEQAAADVQTARAKMQQLQMVNAQAQWDEIGKQVLANPKLGASPIYKQRMAQAATTLGYTVPLDSAGNIDPTEWKPDFYDLMKDTDFEKRVMDMSPDQRRATLGGVRNVPEGFFDMAPGLTAQEQVNFDKYGLSAWQQHAAMDLHRRLLDAQVPWYAGRTAHEWADSQRAVQEGQAAITKANAYAQSVDQQLAVAQARASHAYSLLMQPGYVNLKLGVSAVQESDRQLVKAQQLVDGYDTPGSGALAQAQVGDMPDNDPTGWQNLQTKATMARQALARIQQQNQDAHARLATLQGQGPPSVKPASGAKTVHSRYASPPGNARMGSYNGRAIFAVPGDPNIYDAKTGEIIPGIHP